jgi:large subunit ribosomal protein L25
MAESEVVVAQKRDERGSRAARRLRAGGRVPAVVYGHKEETIPLSVAAEDILRVIHHRARVIDLQTESKVEKALIREIQWDHLGKDVLHVDFARVAADERIEIEVPIELRGIAPGVVAGGLLDQPLHTLTIECLALSAPESIRVNINDLQVDGVIHVRDLHLPPGVKALADPEAIVVHVRAPQVEAAAPAAAPAEQAEPEVIGRPRPEEEEKE